MIGRLKDRTLRAIRREPDQETLRAAGLRLGRNVYIGRGASFDTGFLWLISVGDDATLSANVEILVHDASMKRHLGYTLVKPVTIGRRVYLGLGVIVLPGVTIGDDAIVGAGSVVTRDVPPRTVAVGNPARVVNSLDEHLEKHRRMMAERPVYGHEWTVRGGITPDRKDVMRQELQGGHGYIE